MEWRAVTPISMRPGVLAEAVVDLGAVEHNVRVLREHAGGAQVMAVVKADGYGHGAVEVARAALAAGAAELGVATITEALALRAAGITKWYGSFLANDAIDLDIKAAEIHALLGENGAGKSTLVKCIMGYYHATQGDVLVGGREQLIANPKQAHALGLGMVYQHFTLVPAMTWRIPDRGLLREGMIADLNVIQPEEVIVAAPTVENDLPTGRAGVQTGVGGRNVGQRHQFERRERVGLGFWLAQMIPSSRSIARSLSSKPAAFKTSSVCQP